MGRNVSSEDKLQKRFDSADFEDHNEEEEALSLCDLPLQSNKEDNNPTEAQLGETKPEDFDFELLIGSLSPRSELCSADDIFFKGQILPFRKSFSSINDQRNFSQLPNPKSRSLSRSESITESTIFSSRSSSSRSQISSNSSSSSRIPKPRIQNQFLSHQSPKPQIRIPSSSIGPTRTRKSTVWEFLKLGFVHNPEIELHDLKARKSVSRNSSSSSNSSSRKQRNEKMLLSGCNCAVNSVEPVHFKSEEMGKRKKKEMAKDRTFEWIKELSNSRFGEEEGGHRRSVG